MAAPITDAARASILEEWGELLPVNDRRVRLALRPFELATVRLKTGG